MDYSKVKNVAIIGAGVAGIATAKALHTSGITCTVFEKGSRLGGVWVRGYPNFGVQTQKELYEFPEWPLPPGTPNFTPGPIMQGYIEDYAHHFGIFDLIRFSTSVVSVHQSSGGTGWVVEFEEGTGKRSRETFDLVVVANGLFSAKPLIPDFPGQEKFGGQILHAYDLQNLEILKGKKVAVVGYGKSATDMALASSTVAAKTTNIFRTAYWPVPRKLAGILPFKWGMLSRMTSALLPLYYRPSTFERFIHSALKPLVWFWWRAVEVLLIVQCRLDSRFGTRVGLIPRDPIEVNVFVDKIMAPQPAYYKALRNGAIEPRRSGIKGYTKDGITLQNGEHVKADVAVLATGWQPDYTFLDKKILERLGYGDEGFHFYRQMIHPKVPGMVFIGWAATFENILTYSLQAKWLAELIAGRHNLPGTEGLVDDIAAMKAWRQSWMPFGNARGAVINVHMLHYHDQLVEDFGGNPLRKKGIFAPFKEIFAPYQPSDYSEIV